MEEEIIEEKKPLLRLGETVPDFEATTTHSKIGFQISREKLALRIEWNRV